MNFIKKIFGSQDKTHEEHLAESLSKIESGEVTRIYPILKPGDWVGLQYGAISQTIIGTEEAPELVIGYGYDTPSDFIFLSADMLKGKTQEEIFDEAFNNLEEFKAPLNEVVPGKVIISDGADFCSEKILSKAFMLDLHKRLNAEELWVSIPRRRNMMVTSRKAEPEILEHFMSVHTGTWEDDSYGNAPIINRLFVVIDGEINE